MKKLLSIFVLIFLFGFIAEAKPANPPGGFGIFFSTLNPHGTWIELDYGVVVWRPTIIHRDWAPYRIGEWVWTRDGWYWDSYEPFGHVTYHYGRWYYDDYYGWIWIPDYEWAPAWVEWRYDDVYIGWAPLPPYAVFRINIGIHYTYDYHTPYGHWHFVTYRHFHNPYVYEHFVGHNYKRNIYNRTKYRTNYDYYDGRVVNRGVDVDYVRKRSGTEIRTRDIERVREFSQLEGNRRDRNGNVRTFYIPKDELRRDNNINRDNVKRSERKSTLDLTRVEIGDQREIVYRNERNEVNDRKAVQENRSVEARKDNRKNTRESRDVRINTSERNEGRIIENRNNTEQLKKQRNEQLNKQREEQLKKQRNEQLNKQREEQLNKQRNEQLNKQREEQLKKQRNKARINEIRNKERNNTQVRSQAPKQEKRESQRVQTKTEKRPELKTERKNSEPDRSKTRNRR